MDTFYNDFLSVLEERYPSKSDLVNALMDLLRLEKESVYRRLRRDVCFSAAEMMRIAGAWNISIDNIVTSPPDKTRPFYLKAIDFMAPGEADYAILERHNRDLERGASDPNGLAVKIVNSLPRGLYARSEPLTRFFTMKWRHKFAPEKALVFGDIQIPERMRQIDLKHADIECSFAEMHSIHDPRVIENLVDEIVYYRSIGKLTGADTHLLGDELLALVDYMEDVTLTGYFPNSKSKLFFYLSHTWIEAECHLFRSAYFNLSMVKVMERNSIASTDQSVLDRLMKLAQATKRMSVLMSESNALQQAEFFARQRDLIRKL